MGNKASVLIENEFVPVHSIPNRTRGYVKKFSKKIKSFTPMRKNKKNLKGPATKEESISIYQSPIKRYDGVLLTTIHSNTHISDSDCDCGNCSFYTAHCINYVESPYASPTKSETRFITPQTTPQLKQGSNKIKTPKSTPRLPSSNRRANSLKMEIKMMKELNEIMGKTSSPIFQIRRRNIALKPDLNPNIIEYNAPGLHLDLSDLSNNIVKTYDEWIDNLEKTSNICCTVNDSKIPEAVAGLFSPSYHPKWTKLDFALKDKCKTGKLIKNLERMRI